MVWQATHSIDLAGGGGSNWIDFGDQHWLDGLSDFTILVGTARKATGWYSAQRKLCGRWGSTAAQRQFTLQVGPSTAGWTIRAQLNPPTGSVCIRDYQGTLFGKTPYLIIVRKLGATLDIFVNGVKVPLVGSVPVPSGPLKTPPATQPWRVGDSDLLQDLVMHHAVWGSALTDDQCRAVWARNSISDLRDLLPGPDGTLVDVPDPIVWHPLGTGDTLPDCAPLVGSVHGTVTKASGVGTGAKNTLIPKMPVYENVPPAPIKYSFELSSGFEQSADPRHHAGMPGMCLLLNGDLLIAHSKGFGHQTQDQDVVLVRSRDVGQTWPWPNGQAFPGGIDVEVLALDTATGVPDGLPTNGSSRGSSLHQIKQGPYAGRIVHKVNYNALPIPDPPAVEKWTLVRHTDDPTGMTGWTPWRILIEAGTLWTACCGGHLGFERSDGALCTGIYWRDFIPDTITSEGWYTAGIAASFDGGETWELDSIVASGQHISGGPDYQWEEPCVDVLADGTVYCGLRDDYSQGKPTTWFSFSSNGGFAGGWGDPVYAFDGANWPIAKQLADGTVIVLLRHAVDPFHTEIRWAVDEAAFQAMQWSDAVDLSEPTDSQDIGHSLVEHPSAGVLLAHSNEQSIYNNAALRFRRLNKIW